MSKKPNPRRIPRSQADVDRAKAEADDEATKAWMLFNRAVEEVNSGKLKWKEIAEVKAGFPRDKIRCYVLSYGKDMEADEEKARLVAENIPEDTYNAIEVENMVCATIVRGDVLAVNADW